MANGARLLDEWGNPQFLAAPRKSRDLYFFLLTATPPAAPMGLIWYQGDKGLPGLARKAQISIPTDILALEKIGFAKHDAKAGLILLNRAVRRGFIQSYSLRNVNSWKKRFAAIPNSPLKEEWRTEIVNASTEYPKNIAAKIQQLFASEQELGGASNGKSPQAVEIVRYFADTFAEKGYGTYVANWGKEVQVAKEILGVIEFEDVKMRIDLYFKDEWLSQMASLDFMSFRRNINKFAKSASSMPTKKDLEGYWAIVNKGEK